MSDEQLINMWARWVFSILNDQQIGNKFGGGGRARNGQNCCGSWMYRHIFSIEALKRCLEMASHVKKLHTQNSGNKMTINDSTPPQIENLLVALQSYILRVNDFELCCLKEINSVMKLLWNTAHPRKIKRMPKKFGKQVSFPKEWLSDPMLLFGGVMYWYVLHCFTCTLIHSRCLVMEGRLVSIHFCHQGEAIWSCQELLKDSCQCIVENKMEEKGPPGIKYGIDLGTYIPVYTIVTYFKKIPFKCLFNRNCCLIKMSTPKCPGRNTKDPKFVVKNAKEAPLFRLSRSSFSGKWAVSKMNAFLHKAWVMSYTWL